MRMRFLIINTTLTASLLFLMACECKQSPAANEQTKAPLMAPSATAAPAQTPPPAPKLTPFSAEMSADFMRKVMETSARIETVKKQMAERRATIFDNNPAVKSYRQQLIAMQKEINALLDADPELIAMKLNRDIMWSTMPALPRANAPAGVVPIFEPSK